MEAHRRRADQHVLEPGRLEGSEDADDLVSIHESRVSRVVPIDQPAGLDTSSRGSSSCQRPPLNTQPRNLAYSCRSARIGSIRLARCAGIRPATTETIVNSSTVEPAIAGSCASMPYSCAAT